MDTYTQPVPTKRQYRTLEEKQRIVGEALAEGASVARVHGRTESTPIWSSTGAGCIGQGD